ncbi:hypothetical protein BXZ70DRAFT_1012939 [Cristinia sonorae]|uniref:DUF6697 domain-containing protein n=1 Tax=Cristinia sonorae TaxID=1940300 RepID=A0A8K0UEG1_9AGAR|nr:hypothetical protein BXZ70DRAFT_1012939 [Cristinia sonorae]
MKEERERHEVMEAQHAIELSELRSRIKELQTGPAPGATFTAEAEPDMVIEEEQEQRISSPTDSVTIMSDNGQAHSPDFAKPINVKTDFALLSKPDVPEWYSLKPCLNGSEKDFMSNIPQNVISHSDCNELMYCHQDILWYSPLSRRDHAYIIRPHAHFHPSQLGAKWTPNAELQSITGRMREVFYTPNGPGRMVYYAGTYVCLEIAELLPSEHSTIPPKLHKKLRHETLADGSLLPGKGRAQAFQDINSHYRSGSAKLMCVVLQCVGFNHALYDGLIALRDQAMQNRKMDKQLVKVAKKYEKLAEKRKISEGSGTSQVMKKTRLFA